MGYDLRGGTTAARALGSQGQHPAVVEVAVRQALMQVPEQQTSIVRSAVQSLNLDPVDPNSLAFHLQSGWSGEPHTHCTLWHAWLLSAAEGESMYPEPSYIWHITNKGPAGVLDVARQEVTHVHCPPLVMQWPIWQVGSMAGQLQRGSSPAGPPPVQHLCRGSCRHRPAYSRLPCQPPFSLPCW